MNDVNAKTNNKLLNVVFGFFLCLFSAILFIDIDYPARALSFVFTFVFGYLSYAIYILLFVVGFLLIFGLKSKKSGYKKYLPSAIIVFIGLSVLFSLLLSKDLSFSLLKDKIEILYNAGNYYSPEFIHQTPFMFQSLFQENVSYSVSGGIIGDLILSIIHLSNVEYLDLIITISILSIGVLAFAIPLAICIMKRKEIKKKDSKNQPINKKSDTDIVIDSSLDIIASASKKISNHEVKSEETSNIKVATFNNSEGTLIFADNNVVPNGGLKKAIFKKDSTSKDEIETTSLKPLVEKLEPSIKDEEKDIKSTPTQIEQLSLDFEEQNPIDINVKTEFIEPVEKITPSISNSKIENEIKPVLTPKKERIKFIPPDLSLLTTYEVSDSSARNIEEAEKRKVLLNESLTSFNVKANCISYIIGPAVTRFNIAYSPNASSRQVANVFDDIQRQLGGITGRFQPIVEGVPYSGIELPNAVMTTVGFKDVVSALPPHDKKPLSIAFGKDITGKIIYADLNEFPHMLIAGTTGSGKSIFIHSLIMTLIMRNNPDDLKIVLIDPKRVEMAMYANEPHLLCPIITDPNKAKVCMDKLDGEMERRYDLLAKSGNTDMKSYRKYCEEHPEAEWLPYIVVIIDEYADLVDRVKEIQRPVVSIAQKARAAGIHIIISTQRPSTNVITGVIKGNLPTRVALTTSSFVDSMTIIGEAGAEKLLGKGDMLVQSPLISRQGCTRLQGCYISTKEIHQIVDYLKTNYEPNFNPDFLDLVDHSKEPTTPAFKALEEGSVGGDERYEEVKEFVMREEYASISLIQREFGFGFSRAGKMFARLKKEGIVADKPDTPSSSKGCRVLVHDEFNETVDSIEVTSFEKENI
jgi:S-DNA-T family DNA segregation ATPase FtsK/SpoIIIE